MKSSDEKILQKLHEKEKRLNALECKLFTVPMISPVRIEYNKKIYYLKIEIKEIKNKNKKLIEKEEKNARRGSFTPGKKCLLCPNPIERRDDCLPYDHPFTDELGWAHKRCISERNKTTRKTRTPQHTPKYIPIIPGSTPKKTGEKKRRQRGE